MIVIADTDAAGRHEQLRAQTVLNHRTRFRAVIGRNSQIARAHALLQTLRQQLMAVAVANLRRAGLLMRLNNLVARPQNRHARQLAHRHVHATDRREHANLRRADARSAANHDIPRVRIARPPRDVLSGTSRRFEFHKPLARHFRQLAHHHGIRADRHRRASHDLDRLPRPNRALSHRTRRDFLDQLQHVRRRSRVRRKDRVAVYGAAMKRWPIAIRPDVLGQIVTQRIAQPDALHRRARRLL